MWPKESDENIKKHEKLETRVNNVPDLDNLRWVTCMEHTFLGNNENNDPHNVNIRDHVQESATRIIIEVKNICDLG